jgi:low temperature requirement protein LtrA
MSGSELALETHLGNTIALLFGAVAISFILYKFYKEGVYSKTGMIAGQVGLWFVTLFMLYTIN